MADPLITAGKHMLLTTFRTSGDGVSTPVWTVPVSDGRVGMWTAAGTGKYKRLRNNPHVTIQACSARGKPTPGDRILHGTAEITQGGALFDEVQTKIRAKYGWQIPIVKRVSRLQGPLQGRPDLRRHRRPDHSGRARSPGSACRRLGLTRPRSLSRTSAPVKRRQNVCRWTGRCGCRSDSWSARCCQPKLPQPTNC